jgi:hypothetical protein
MTGPPFTLLGGMSTENLRDYLVRRHSELEKQIAALRGQLTAKETEQADVRKAMAAVGMAGTAFLAYVDDQSVLTISQGQEIPAGSALAGAALAGSALAGASAAPPLTIKQMILHALNDHFHEGATPAELRDYIRVAYGREVDKKSISPQLARLRDEGYIQQPPGMLNEGKWQLCIRGKQIAVGEAINGATQQEDDDLDARAKSASRAQRHGWYDPPNR